MPQGKNTLKLQILVGIGMYWLYPEVVGKKKKNRYEYTNSPCLSEYKTINA